MATIHKLSGVATLSQLDLFMVPPTQLQIAEDILSEHTPFTAITNSMTPIQFTTSTARDEYINLRKSELSIKMKISLNKYSVKPEEGKLTLEDWKKICPINYLLNTMWKNFSLEINNVPVNSTSLNQAYTSYIDALLYTSDQVKNTHLETALWCKDTAGHMEQINQKRSEVIRPINNNYNEGIEIDLTGYLHLDLCAQRKAMVGGVNYNLTLYPHDPKFYLNYNSSLQPTVQFTDVRFEFHRSKIIPQVFSAIDKALSMGSAKYPITRKECLNFIIPKDTIDFHENNVVKNGRLPRKCFIALVSNEAYNGDPGLNPFNFKHYNIQNIRCVLNSKEFPPRGFDCNFQTKKISKPFRCMYEALGQIDDPQCSITKYEWMNGFTIFGFNFIPDLSDGVNRSGYVSPIKVGDMSIHIIFRTPTPETASLIVFREFDNIIEIPEDRIPIKDFT